MQVPLDDAQTNVRAALEHAHAVQRMKTPCPPCATALVSDLTQLQTLHARGHDIWNGYIALRPLWRRWHVRGSTFDAVAVLDKHVAGIWMMRLREGCAELPRLLKHMMRFALELEDNLEFEAIIGPASIGNSLPALIAAARREDWRECAAVLQPLIGMFTGCIADLLDMRANPVFFRYVLTRLLAIRALLPVENDFLLDPMLLSSSNRVDAHLLRGALSTTSCTLYDLYVHVYGHAVAAGFVVGLLRRIDSAFIECADVFVDALPEALRGALLTLHRLPIVWDAEHVNV